MYIVNQHTNIINTFASVNIKALVINSIECLDMKGKHKTYNYENQKTTHVPLLLIFSITFH